MSSRSSSSGSSTSSSIATTGTAVSPTAIAARERGAEPREPRIITPYAWFALAISLVLTVVMGIVPGAVFDLAGRAASALFH
jgi:hypothetical protein